MPGIEIGPQVFSWLAWNVDRVLPVVSFSFAEGFSVLFLGEIAKSDSVMSFRPSGRLSAWNNSDSHWTEFDYILYFGLFCSKICREVLLKSDKNNR